MRSLTLTLSWISLLTTSLLAGSPARASQLGRDGFSGNPDTNGGAICTACHAPGAELPGLAITGPTQVDASTTHLYTATLTGGPAATGGVNLSAQGALGDLQAVDGDLAPIGGELSHTSPKPFAGEQVSFQFAWTAPSFNGDVTLYGAANSTDGNLDLLGDGIAAAQLVVTVVNGGPPPPPEPPPPPATVVLEPFASGFERPVGIAHAGDDRLFVVEQAGRIRIVENDGTVLERPFLDIRDAVDSTGNEQGLLGLAFDPAYLLNGFFYVYYTVDGSSGADRSRVSRFRVSLNPDVARLQSEQVFLEFEQPAANHNGGDIRFGPDGYLYIASGDGGFGGDPLDQGQDPSSLLGKMLRIDVGGSGGFPDCDLTGSNLYGVPLDNAFRDGVGGAGCDEIWALGLRNPWRFSFDRVTGDLWIADVGESRFEEVDFIPSGTAAGLNLGWRCYEGFEEFDTTGCSAAYFEPVHAPDHLDGDCSITGGFVHRGSEEPSLVGRYLFTDVCNTAVRAITPTGSGFSVEEVLPAGAVSLPVSFGEDVAGALYLASLSGEIFRIRQNPPEVPTLLPWPLAAAMGGVLMTGLVARRRSQGAGRHAEAAAGPRRAASRAPAERPCQAEGGRTSPQKSRFNPRKI